MDKNRVEGKAKDIKGRVKRQVGEWTDDAKLQGEGAMDQAEGKVQNAWGKVKDAARDVRDESHRDHDRDSDIRKKDDRAA